MKLSARLAAATVLVASGLAGVSLLSASPASAVADDWCSVDPVAPCIVSIQREGSAPQTANNAAWQAELSVFDNGGAYTQLVWSLRHTPTSSLDLPITELGHRWTITIDTGSVIPRVSNAFGLDGTVTRTDDLDGTYKIAVSAEPEFVSIGGCDISTYPWPCYSTSPSDEIRFGGTVDDWNQWEDPVQRAAFYGVDFFTNVEVTSFPPGVMYDDATGIAAMRLDFAAPRFFEDGDTLEHGFFEATLPNDFLHENFFIPDPTTMTPGSLLVTGMGPFSTVDITKESPSAPMHVVVGNMTFPEASIAPTPRVAARAPGDDDHIRKLRVKTGTVVPTKPTDLRATRVSSSKAKIGYDLSEPRGFAVTGYRARCESPGGHVASATKSENASPIYVGGLHSATPYTCKVRALSDAGPGPWSVGVQVARRP